MIVENPDNLPKEGEVFTEKDQFNADRDEFQASKHYDFVMKVIDAAIEESEVKKLLAKHGGAADEKEIGKLTLIEWLANEKINKKIKERLSYGR